MAWSFFRFGHQFRGRFHVAFRLPFLEILVSLAIPIAELVPCVPILLDFLVYLFRRGVLGTLLLCYVFELFFFLILFYGLLAQFLCF